MNTNPKDIYLIHSFGLACEKNGIEHRLTKPAHPWTNVQIERMSRTIKETTLKRYHDKSHNPLKQHLHTFMMAYHHAKRLKTLKSLTPYEYKF